MDLFKHLSDFINFHSLANKRLLLALSGGPDSMALFHLLLENRRRFSISFAVAHVDHQWRSESSAEAEQLHHLAQQSQVDFHIKKLEPNTLVGNLEEACRQERLTFFKELCVEKGYEGVLMGHHADDQAETVLKRLFEGAHLTKLSGMHPKSSNDGLTILRPFLQVKKKDLIRYLESKKAFYFEDRTNSDEKYLRARMRETIVPVLSKKFGKEVQSALCTLSEESAELKEFLDGRIAPYLMKITQSKERIILDLSTKSPDTMLELKYLLRQLCAQFQLALSRECVHMAAKAFLLGNVNVKLSCSNKIIEIQKNHIIIK